MALLEFYGDGCVHCVAMQPLVERLKVEEGLDIEQVEVWGNETNAERMAEIDKGLCGGVPLFYNTDTKAFICGETEYDELKAWAKNHSEKKLELAKE